MSLSSFVCLLGLKAMPVTRLSRASSKAMPLVMEFNVETALCFADGFQRLA